MESTSWILAQYVTDASRSGHSTVLTDAMQKVIRNKPRKEPTWKYTDKVRAAVRKTGRAGIDWYKYQEVTLKKKLVPWAKKHSLAYLGMIVQEDGAPAHS